jgi:hypothetical protein
VSQTLLLAEEILEHEMAMWEQEASAAGDDCLALRVIFLS